MSASIPADEDEEGILATEGHSSPEPAPRWVGAFLGVCAVLFVPYIVVLAFTLPSHARAAHYDLAWVGLDAFELLTLAATAWCAWTRSTWVALTATAAATLLLCDAWFDVVTSRGGEHRALAIAAAVVVEVPLAAFCGWIARHAEVVHGRALG